jgi:DNA-binding GntR family transcriptional regulator
MRKPEHSLADRAFSRIKQDILRCHFRPGSVIKESDLAARYGMSKTPVREALSLLRREGFIEVLPRRGILIRPVELQDVQNTFLLRMLLEPEAAALAATRASSEQFKRVSDTCDALRRSDRGLGGHERLVLHRAFHVAIAEASGIPELAPMVRGLHEKVEWFYNHHRLQTPDHPMSDEHGRLADAIVSGDPEHARAVMAENIRTSRQHLIDALIREPRMPGLTVVERPA